MLSDDVRSTVADALRDAEAGRRPIPPLRETWPDIDVVDAYEIQLLNIRRRLEAGAGVSIGIVTAGLKGSVTLTISLDLNDPDDDGRLRSGEIDGLDGCERGLDLRGA